MILPLSLQIKTVNVRSRETESNKLSFGEKASCATVK